MTKFKASSAMGLDDLAFETHLQAPSASHSGGLACVQLWTVSDLVKRNLVMRRWTMEGFIGGDDM